MSVETPEKKNMIKAARDAINLKGRYQRRARKVVSNKGYCDKKQKRVGGTTLIRENRTFIRKKEHII